MSTCTPIPKPANLSREATEEVAEVIAARLEIKRGTSLKEMIGAVKNRLKGKVVLEKDPTAEIEVIPDKGFTVRLPKYAAEQQQRVTLAHEIGHYVLHSRLGEVQIRMSYGGDTQIEIEANWFALALLLPASEFKAFFQENPRLDKVAAAFNVTLEVVVARARQMNLSWL